MAGFSQQQMRLLLALVAAGGTLPARASARTMWPDQEGTLTVRAGQAAEALAIGAIGLELNAGTALAATSVRQVTVANRAAFAMYFYVQSIDGSKRTPSSRTFPVGQEATLDLTGAFGETELCRLADQPVGGQAVQADPTLLRTANAMTLRFTATGILGNAKVTQG